MGDKIKKYIVDFVTEVQGCKRTEVVCGIFKYGDDLFEPKWDKIIDNDMISENNWKNRS